MSLDTQHLANMVESMADRIDRHMESIFLSVRSTLESSNWVPDAIKPPQRHVPAVSLPLSYIQKTQAWIDRNRAVTAAIVAFAGTSAVLVWRRQRLNKRKRKARRGALGAKVEAIVLAGPPESQLTRSLASDLEKRGFLVYIPTDSLAGEQMVAAEGKHDIMPMHLDLSSVDSIASSLTKFTNDLSRVTRSQPVHIASLIVLPNEDSHPRLPISALDSSMWSNSIYLNLQRPIDLIHAFVPLLQTQLSIPTRTNPPTPTPPTTIVVLTPGIASSLPLPDHATEAVANAGLASFLRTLRCEIPPSLQVSHIQMGAIDLGDSKRQVVLHDRSRSTSPAAPPGARSDRADWTPARTLHHAVFDALTGRTGGTTFVGRGARTYAFVGKYMPSNLARWMVGMHNKSAREHHVIADTGSEDWESVDRSIHMSP